MGIGIDRDTKSEFILFHVKPVNYLKFYHLFIKLIHQMKYSSYYDYVIIIKFLHVEI